MRTPRVSPPSVDSMEDLPPASAVCNSGSEHAKARDIVCADEILVDGQLFLERQEAVEMDSKEEEDKDGAQHVGTGMGLGGRRGIIERGNIHKLAARSKVAVVKVIANETAKRSWRAVCGCGCEEEQRE